MGVRRTSNSQWGWSTPSGATAGDWRFRTAGVEFIEGDDCADAVYVYGASERPVNNVNATGTDGPIDQCAQTGRDVWFRLFLDCGGTVRVSTCGTVNCDGVIEPAGAMPSVAVVAQRGRVQPTSGLVVG